MQTQAHTTPRAYAVLSEGGRTFVRFPGKPAGAVRDFLKRRGAQWCRTRGAWMLPAPRTAA